MDIKNSEKDLNRLILAAVLLTASTAAMITGGLMLEKRDAAIPAVEIIDAEETVFYSEPSEAVALESTAWESTAAKKLMININTAGAEELMKLKGVGEKTAEKIIEYRRETPFETIEDIMNVNGIGEKKFEDMRDMICV